MWRVTNASLKETPLSLNVDLFNDKLCLSLAANHPSSHISNTLHASANKLSACQLSFCQSQSTRDWKSWVQRAGERRWGQMSCVNCKVRDWNCCSCTSNTSQDSRAEPVSTQHLSSHLTVTSLWAAIYSAALKTCKQSGKITFINGTIWKSEAALQRSNKRSHHI